jgi:hypothetical protein
VLELLATPALRLGMPALRWCFPDVPRAELADLRARYHRVLRRRYHALGYALHWLRPGRVWAVDFAEPEAADGTAPWTGGDLVAVRDLASGYQLAWQRVPQMTAAAAVRVLAGLFARHGAPWSSSATMAPPSGPRRRRPSFTRRASGSCTRRRPTPRTNGAIEAGIGSLKTRTEEHAQSRGRLHGWTFDDLASARAEANHTPRRRGPSPADTWQARPSITALERACFDLVVQRRRFEARTRLGIPPDVGQDHCHRSALDRQALRRALVEHGDLRFTRTLIPLTLNRRKMANIT